METQNILYSLGNSALMQNLLSDFISIFRTLKPTAAMLKKEVEIRFWSYIRITRINLLHKHNQIEKDIDNLGFKMLYGGSRISGQFSMGKLFQRSGVTINEYNGMNLDKISFPL